MLPSSVCFQMKIRNLCCEIFDTSTLEVFFPVVDDCISSLLNDADNVVAEDQRPNFLNLSEFPTTLTELNAIAAAAIIGLSNPRDASGIPTTL